MFTVDGYKIYFKHYPDKRLTVCLIDKVDEEDNKTPVADGMAFCNPIDNFSRSTGRKIALSRASKIFPKEFRAKLWVKYFEMCPRR